VTSQFADTGFYVALLNPRDALHTRALDRADVSGVLIVTTEYVLLEVATFFAAPAGRGLFVQLVRDIQADPHTLIVPASPVLFDRALDLFASRPDKGWSLTDCASFVAMADRRLTDALTADRHFAQAGFAPLLT
jgi:predicted nucleic acid-binding protein